VTLYSTYTRTLTFENGLLPLPETPLHLAASAGALECIKELFLCSRSAGSVQVIATEVPDLGAGMTPFLAACAGAHMESVKFLLGESKFAAHSFSSDLDTGMHLLLRRLTAIKLGENVVVEETQMLSVEFASAFFAILVQAGCDIFGKNSDGLSPSALARELSAASEVLEQLNNAVVKGDLDKTLARCTCLHCTKRTKMRRDEIFQKDDGVGLKALILKYASARETLSTVDEEFNTLLHQVCGTGKVACLRVLLDSRYFDKSLVMLHNAEGKSPLHVAILANDQTSLDMLLGHIASGREVPLPHSTNSAWLAAAVLDTVGQGVTTKATPATLAEDSPEFEHAGKRNGLAAVESSAGEFEGANCLHLAAAMRGGAELLDRLLKALEDGEAAKEISRPDARGLTCMHIACLCLQLESIRVVVKRVGTRSPLIHALTSDGQRQTSVHLAVQARPAAPRSEAELAILPVVRELLLLGADATALDANLQISEDLARKFSLPEVAEVLSNVESPASKLTRAVLARDAGSVRAQLEDMKVTGSLAATINGKGRDGKSAMHHACAEGFLPGVNLLLDYEANIQDTDITCGGHGLWWAIRHGRGDVAAFLCRKGANPAGRAKDGSSALHGACRNGLTAIVETLLGDRALHTSWADGEGLTALDLACAQGHVPTIKAFVISRPNCVNEVNSAGESPLFAAVRGMTSKAVEISELLVDEGVDPKRASAQGKSVLDVAREKDKADPILINWLSSLLHQGVGYIPEDGEETSATQRVRRPRISGRTNGDARLDLMRLAAARLTSQVQSEQAQAKQDALELQRQEALVRREANKTRASARAALLARSAARHPMASGFRAGRLTAEVINAKVPNRINADRHVLQVWKDDDFFRCELEIEHLLGSTAAAVSAEPVWREKLVMPVLESGSSVAVRLLLRTFRGTNVDWEVIGSHQLLVASLVMPTVSTGEDADWIQVFAKRWPSKPDLVPTANLRIKLSYVQHVPDQVAADQDLNSIQKFSMPQPVPGNLASHIQHPPGPDAGGPAAPRPRNAGGGSHRSEQSAAVSKGTQQAAAVVRQGLHLHAEQDFVDAGAWLRDAGFQHHAVKDLMARLREAKSLFLSALRAHKNQSGHGEGDLLPTPELRKYLSMMGYLDDEIQNVLEDLDPEDTGFISLERFLLKGSLILDGYGAFDHDDLRSDMISSLVHKDSSREAARAAAMESPHAATTHSPLASSKPGEAWGQVYVAVVSATDLAMSGSCTLAVVVSLVVDPPGHDAETSAEGAENASNVALPRVHSHDPFDGRVVTKLKTGYVDAAGPVKGIYEWNEDMMFALPLDPQKFADVLSQERLERRQRVGLAVEVQERLADGATRLVGHTRIEFTEGQICRTLEEARHYDKPFRLSSGKDVCVRVRVKKRERECVCVCVCVTDRERERER
jgi:ankyrin repeat protein